MVLCSCSLDPTAPALLLDPEHIPATFPVDHSLQAHWPLEFLELSIQMQGCSSGSHPCELLC